MITRLIRVHIKRLGLAAMVVALAGLCLPPAAFGKIVQNTIDSEASVNEDGRLLVVTGPIQGDTTGERAYIRVTVTQRLTGAVAEGVIVFILDGELQQWEAHLTTKGRAAFAEGAATAVAIARATSAGIATDAHQWLVEIALIKQ